MTMVQKFIAPLIHKRICSDFVKTALTSSKIPIFPIWLLPIFQNPRAYSTMGTPSVSGDRKGRISCHERKQAQNALLDYFYITRNLLFMDAENMSKNAPYFLEKLLEKINTEEEDVGWSVTRFLRYHPINEFEPFFESSGLSPIEYVHLLPRDLMFLSDDEFLLNNHIVLCNYGIARGKIGKIYKEATEVFRYGYGVLPLKLKTYEDLGFSQSFICKAIVCSPNLLIGDVNMKFIEVLRILKTLGIEMDWIERQLLDKRSLKWSTTYNVLSFFSKNGFGNEELSGIISQHPGLIFHSSGDTTFTLIGVQIKFGSSIDEVCSIFHHFPQIQVEKFVYNFRRCIHFLLEIEMNSYEIGKIIRSHSLLLGTCNLKKANSIYAKLNVGKKRLCSLIQKNPQELKKLVLGSKLGPLPSSGAELKSKLMKTKFLEELGYAENSDSMKRALKMLRGKASKLQERFDCLVKVGLDRKDVCEIVRISPQILNKSQGIILSKIDFLVNELGYPISTLMSFPRYLNYTCERIKLRLLMYNWLKDQGKVETALSLSTIIVCSERKFITKYVNRHPKGPQVWKDLKETNLSGI